MSLLLEALNCWARAAVEFETGWRRENFLITREIRQRRETAGDNLGEEQLERLVTVQGEMLRSDIDEIIHAVEGRRATTVGVFLKFDLAQGGIVKSPDPTYVQLIAAGRDGNHPDATVIRFPDRRDVLLYPTPRLNSLELDFKKPPLALPSEMSSLAREIKPNLNRIARGESS